MPRKFLATLCAVFALLVLSSTRIALTQQPVAPVSVEGMETSGVVRSIWPVYPEQLLLLTSDGQFHSIDGVPLIEGQEYWLLGGVQCQNGSCIVTRCSGSQLATLDSFDNSRGWPIYEWLEALIPDFPYIGLRARLTNATERRFTVINLVGFNQAGYCDVPTTEDPWVQGTILQTSTDTILTICTDDIGRMWELKFELDNPILQQVVQAHNGYLTRVQGQFEGGSWDLKTVKRLTQIHFENSSGCGRKRTVYMPYNWRCNSRLGADNIDCKTRQYKRYFPLIGAPIRYHTIYTTVPFTRGGVDSPGYTAPTSPQSSEPQPPAAEPAAPPMLAPIQLQLQPAAAPQRQGLPKVMQLRERLPSFMLNACSVVIDEDADIAVVLNCDDSFQNILGQSLSPQDRGWVSPGSIDCDIASGSCLIVNSNALAGWQLRLHNGKLWRIYFTEGEQVAHKSAVAILGQIGAGLHFVGVVEATNCPLDYWSCGDTHLVHIMVNTETMQVFEKGRIRTNRPAAIVGITELEGKRLLHIMTAEGEIITLDDPTYEDGFTEALGYPRFEVEPVAELVIDQPGWTPGNMATINDSFGVTGQYWFIAAGDNRGLIWADLWNRQHGIAATYLDRNMSVAVNYHQEANYGHIAVHGQTEIAEFVWNGTTRALARVHKPYQLPSPCVIRWQNDDQCDIAWRDGTRLAFGMNERDPYTAEFVEYGTLFLLMNGWNYDFGLNMNPLNMMLPIPIPPPGKSWAAGNSAWQAEFPGYKEPPTPTPVPTITPTPTDTATPTPTPTDTPTPTPTPTIVPCIPQRLLADVVLVTDTSSSMESATKLPDSIRALKAFVDMLVAPNQMAIVWFARTAGINEKGLTTDRLHLFDVIDRLQTNQGTSIDQGLLRAREELASSRHIPTHSRVVVLMSDGGQNGVSENEVLRIANEAKAEGVNIFTIGLGEDADKELLKAIASRPEQSYIAPTSADLEAIYQQVARDIPCPTPFP